MTRKEMIELIIMKMSDDDVRRLSFRYTGDDSGLSLEKLLLAENSMHQALALAALKDWVFDERLYFYASPMVGGLHYAHFGDGEDFVDEVTDDNEYWAMAKALALAIRQNKYPIQEDVLGEDPEAPNEDFSGNMIQVRSSEMTKPVRQYFDLIEKDINGEMSNEVAYIEIHLGDNELFRQSAQHYYCALRVDDRGIWLGDNDGHPADDIAFRMYLLPWHSIASIMIRPNT